MSAILDKEMPVKKKKKRFFLLFFFFGLLGVIALGITFAPVQVNEKIVDGAIADEAIIDSEFSVDDDNDKEIIESHVVTNNDLVVDEYEKATVLAPKINIEQQEHKISTNNFIGINYKNEIDGTTENKSFLIDEKTIVEYDNGQSLIRQKVEEEGKLLISNDKLITENKLDGFNSGSVVENYDNEISERLVDDFRLLEPIALNFSLLKNERNEKEKLPTNFNYKKWRFGIEGGTVVQNKNEFGGKLGFVTTRHLNKKWAFHTGLEYNAHFINYTAAESANAFEASNQMDDFGTDVTGVGDYQSIYLDNSTKLNTHFLKVPLLVGYRFHPSFELHGGIVNSFNIYSGEGNGILASDALVNLGAPENNAAATKKTISPLYDLQVSLGMTYHPSRKWGVSLRYDYGFIRKEITANIPESAYQAASKSSVGIKGYGSHYRLLNLSAKMYF